MDNIISIDDSSQVRNIVRNAVEVLGYGFLEAPDGEQGLEMVKSNVDDISLIVLDVNMPGMLGTELLKIIKSDDALKSIPVMMVTTESESEAIIGAIRSGANNYVTKPFTQEELITKMVESLGAVPEF